MTGPERPVLWAPTSEQAADTRMAAFIAWLKSERGLEFPDYNALWEWSISDLDGFWSAIWSFFDLQASVPPQTFLAERRMPGATWCPGTCLNFAQNILRQAEKTPDRVALVVQSETFGDSRLTWADLSAQVASVASEFRRLGVAPGDRVAAILPNTETALIACLATLSIGAVWSLCAPDMGHVAVLDRFRQIEPKLLITQDGYVHAGQMIDRRAVLQTIADGLPGVAHRVVVPVLGPVPENSLPWSGLTAQSAEHDFEQVPFDHPLWVVYSSGTTGNPKPIVHGHGGVLLEGAKQSLHQDIKDSDRFCWLTSSGWIMWNVQLVALGQGASLALFDGAANHPDMLEVWRFVARHRLTIFGAGAAFFTACAKSGIRPKETLDLAPLRALGATGSPLTADAYRWIYDAVKADVWLAPISGGTDFCGAFVGGNPMLPVRDGEMQCRFLGNAVRAFDEAGKDLTGQVGELVCTEPLPSMPLYFWGDEDGKRLQDSYFDAYPGIWRHGDWIEITPEGGAIIYGRSDATINRRGLRIGSAEIYQAVEALPEVLDSLVVDLEYLGRDSFLALFLVLPESIDITDALRHKVREAIRTSVSARFLPDDITAIPEVPRTLSGKKLEVPVRKILLGQDASKVVNRDSMANPDSLNPLIRYATSRSSSGSDT